MVVNVPASIHASVSANEDTHVLTSETSRKAMLPVSRRKPSRYSRGYMQRHIEHTEQQYLQTKKLAVQTETGILGSGEVDHKRVSGVIWSLQGSVSRGLKRRDWGRHIILCSSLLEWERRFKNKYDIRRNGKALRPQKRVGKNPTWMISWGARKTRNMKQSSQETCPNIMAHEDCSPPRTLWNWWCCTEKGKLDV